MLRLSNVLREAARGEMPITARTWESCLAHDRRSVDGSGRKGMEHYELSELALITLFS